MKCNVLRTLKSNFWVVTFRWSDTSCPRLTVAFSSRLSSYLSLKSDFRELVSTFARLCIVR